MKYKLDYINISRKKLKKSLKERVSQQRYEHILGVEKAAIRLAKIYGYEDHEKVSIAALLHDYCKEIPAEEMLEGAKRWSPEIDWSQGGPSIWHGPAAAQYAFDILGLRDREILESVSQHTIGDPKMSLLSKIIFVADYVEPGRDFTGVDKARKIANQDLNRAVFHKMQETIIHLAQIGKPIFPLSLTHYNAWTQKRRTNDRE